MSRNAGLASAAPTSQQPSNLATSINCTGVTFSWQGNSGTFCVKIYYQSGTVPTTCTTTTTQESYFMTSTALVSSPYLYYPGVKINWSVDQTENGKTTSSATTAQTTTSFFYDVPWANMSAPSQTYQSSNQSQKFSWTNMNSATNLQDGGSQGINGYILELSSDGGSTYTTLATVTPANNNAYYTTMPSAIFSYNTPYRVRVICTNSCGRGRFSGTALSYTSSGVIPQTAPTGLAVTVNDGSAVTLVWTAIPNTNNDTGGFPVTSYKLEQVNVNTTSNWQQVTNSMVYTFSITNAADNIQYTYRVSAVNSQGQGVGSANVTIITPMAPVFMATPTSTSMNCTHVRIDWTAPNTYNAGRLNIIHYNLQYKLSTQVNGKYANVNAASGYTTLYFEHAWSSMSNFNWATSYDYWVNSVNSMGASPFSNALTVISPTIPGQMGAPSIATTDITPAKIKITWTALTTATETGRCPISGYLLEVATVGSNSWSSITTSTYALTYYEWTGPYTHNTNYQFRVTAYNGAGSGTVSTTGTAQTDTYPGTANLPTCVASNINPTNITLSWTDLTFGTATGRDTITYYKLEWYDQYATSKAWVTVNTAVTFSLSAMHTITYYLGVFPSGAVQTYRLSAMNGVGFGPVTANVTCTCDSIPSGMGDLTAASVNPMNITVTWTDLTTAANGGDVPIFYLLQWYNAPTTTWVNLTTDGVTGKVLTYTHVVTTNFNPLVQQQYRVKPKNGVGWGSAFSNILYVTVDNVPQQMSAVTAVINPSEITLSWTDLTTTAQHGGDIPYYYQVEWYGPSGWTILTNEAMGKFLTYTHNISPSIFASNSNQQYRVTPKNGVGMGVASTTVSLTADREPQAMNTPTSVSTDPLSIKIQWTDLAEPDNGRDLITFYLFECDFGTNEGTWTALNNILTDSKVTSFDHTSLTVFPENVVFKYRIRPKNGVGWGPYSSSLSVTTDQKPTTMNAPVITDANINPYWIYITWSSLSTESEKGRDEPVYYGIEWDQGASIQIWVNLTAETVGITNAFNLTSATVFPLNTVVKFRTFAKNGCGYSPYSTETSITTDDIPSQMAAPITVDITYNTITVKWGVVTSTAAQGRDTILLYRLQWDNYLYNDLAYLGIESTVPWTTIGTTTQDAAQTYLEYAHSVSPNFLGYKNISYRIQAENGAGVSPWSDPLFLITDDVPLQMTSPVITDANIQANQIVITWNAQASTDIGGDPIQYYKLEWDQGDATKTMADAWTELTDIANGVQLSYTHTSGATPFANNTVFRYRLISKNGVGYSNSYSDPTSITTDRTPLKPIAPTNGTVSSSSIQLSWTALTTFDDTGRDPITNYKILYHDGTSWSDLVEVASTVTSYTHTPASSFPANVDRSDFIVMYKVIGKNGVGYGIESDDLLVVTDTYPRKMDMPSVIGDITPRNILVGWTQLTTSADDTGRDPIAKYRLRWAPVSNPTSWTQLVRSNPSTTQFNVTNGFSINTEYYFQVAAENGVGVGAYSDSLLVLTDNVPTRMNDPTEDSTTNANLIKVNWASITDDLDTGRDGVIYYKLEWDQSTNTWTELTTPNASVNTFSLTTASDGIQNGTSYKFRVTPLNRAGYGAVSSILTVIPSSPPDQMATVAVNAQSASNVVSVQIVWTAPQNNGAVVTSYIIKVKGKDNQYYTELANCDGSQSTIVTAMNCYIFHAKLREAPFNLVKGDNIIAIANAANIKGYNNSYSVANSATATVEDVPVQMGAVSRNNGQTTYNKLTVTFSALTTATQMGGTTCTISSYHVQRDQGNNTANTVADVWTDIKGFASNDTSLTAQQTSTIIGGTTYKVRVRALNKHGWGPWSATANIRAASAPAAPATVTTANDTVYIAISWDLPFNNGFDVTSYKIEIAKKSGSWGTSSECDGTDPTIIAARTCKVLMTTLRVTTTYNYVYNDVPVFRVSGYNLEGQGSTRNSSGVGAIQTEPLAPGTTVGNDPANTNDLQIKLNWAAVTGISNWRGYEVSSYEIWWQDKDGTFPYELLYTDTKPFLLTYTHKNKGTSPDVGDTEYPTQAIVGGTKYKFKYRAVNIHGPGPFSVESLFFASTIPDQLDPAVTSLYNQTVTIAWNPTPNDHKQSVTAYRVKIRNKAGTYVEDTTICNGVKSAVVSAMKCTALMSLFTTNLNLAIDDLIVVQVEAQNVMGYSIPSNPNTDGVTAKKLPQTAPSALSRGVNTGKTQVQLNWVGITANVDTGGQDVDYKVYFDKATGGSSWYTLTESTTNLTTYTDSASFTVGKAYQFKVAAFNDFGIGPQSSAFTVYSAIAPSGLPDPSTTLNLLTYVEEDDIILIDWVPPTDDGGLAVSYKVEVIQSSGVWLEVDQPTECSEKGTITNYFIPQATTANAPTQCSILVSKLKSKWGLAVGDTVLARITAFHVVGSVTTTSTGAGTAQIPTPPCMRTTFPRIIGGSNAASSITAMDMDTLGNIAAGGYSQDSGLLGKTPTATLPVVHYIAKGNYYAWGKYIETGDGTTMTTLFQQVLDIAFRFDGSKIALSLDRATYAHAYFIVILNQDGSFYGAFKEGNNQKGKVNITSTLFDNSNMITLGLDISQDGTDQKKYASIVRFSAANPSATSISSSLYIQGGAVGKISQALTLQRIKADATSIYVSALIQDGTANRRALIGRMTLSNGAFTKYFQYTSSAVSADYNTDLTIAGVRRMSLYEDDISTLHIVSTCIPSYDGFRMHFGQFIFSTTQLFTVLTPSTISRWYCLGMYQRVANMAYTLYNDRSANLPSGYGLYYGRIDYVNKKVESIAILNHDGNNNYYGASFVHLSRFYYWGETQKIITTSTFNFGQKVGFVNLFDSSETKSCLTTGQNYNFASPSVTITLDTIVSANMNWQTSGYSSGPNFAAQTGKTFRGVSLTGGLYNINLKEPISNNTYCPIVTTPAPAAVLGQTIAKSVLTYDPDATSYPNQEVFFSAFTLSKTCPDQVNYYSTFIADNSQPLPSFITFDPSNTKYIFGINNPAHVGTYNIILQATIGNNMTTGVTFQVQVASPCLNVQVNIPALSATPTYDISDLVPLYVDLNWQVVNPPTTSCGEIFFNFKLVNNTVGGVVDTTVFSIINTTSGLQQLKIWTQAIPAAKTWTDLKIEARLQGDLVKTNVYTIIITNKCAVTVIDPVVIPDQIYYHGRDPIDFLFVWPETVGVCGPITYSANEYIDATPSSNNTLDNGVFLYPKPSGGNNTLRIYTWDESKVGLYKVRVWASLGVGGYKQSSTIFSVQIVRDPCSYFPYVTSFVEDLTLWINQTDQILNIPPFTMNDTSWICNFTYELRNGLGQTLDPVFVLKEAANQGDGTNITLVTTDKTKVDLSPQTVRVRGWPKRQNTTYAQFTFRIFVAYLDKSDCPSGQWYDTTTEVCLNCASPCSTCKGSATTCTWCIANYVFIEKTSTCSPVMTTPDCPAGTIKDPYFSYCRNCPDFCSSCSSVTTCTACVKGYYLTTNTNGTITCSPPKSCPAGYRSDDANGCVACSSNCASCPSSSTCNLCMQGYYLDTTTKQCTQNCPAGYYGDSASRVCMICSPACATCVNNNYTCTSCRDIGGVQYYLFENTCVTRCPYLGYFQNEPARTCDACKAACKICVNAIDDCIVCNTGSVISGRECLNSCPAGYYITVIGTCFQCDPTCQRCYGSQNSMCYECVTGQYLTQTTCDSKCSPPLFPDAPSKTCKNCPYYCNSCTNANNCQKCKIGYKQEPQDCSGEMFLRVTSSQTLSVPINTALVPEDYNPSQMAIELWFKADNIMSVFQEVILGLSPYKLRKKNGVAQVQLNFGDFSFCDSKNLKSDQWYHFAFSISEESGGSLYCYINGEIQSVGQTPISTIATDIVRPKEISFGTSVDIKTSESKFNGYIKEFRWWKKIRNQFQLDKFKNTAITTLTDFNPPNEILAYWKFDEKKTDLKFTDFASKGTLQFDPLASTGFKVLDFMEMREIFLKMCPEGTYMYFNETLGYYNCTACHPDCGNCDGETNTSCTSCIAPYKLLETEKKCIIAVDCPKGYWQDVNKNCWPCHPYCTECYGGDQFQCTACQQGFFKAYKRAGCVDSCPRGLYGNYLTQSCSANPVVTSLYPEDNIVLEYGTFIDLFATFIVQNEEPRSTYSYGWIISKLSDSSLDIAKDATKAYAGQDITRVHLDNNIIEPNQYYNITFYVRGDEKVYNGMIGTMFNVIYIGIPPKGGACSVTPFQGVAGATEFTITTGNWKDPDGISEFKFLFSLDNGETYLPIPQQSFSVTSIKYVFDPIFKTVNAKVKCQVKNLKGFQSQQYTTFLLAKKSSTNSKTELGKISLQNVTTEQQSLRVGFQLSSIAQDIGQLKPPPESLFDPKVNPDQCTEELCGFSGECKYQTFTKQYYCSCYGSKAGRNCTFRNETELEYMRNLTFQNAQIFTSRASGSYNKEFLTISTKDQDLMSDDLFDKVHDIIFERVLKITDVPTGATMNLDDAQDVLQILSNLLEYLDNDRLKHNVTGYWNSTNNTDVYQEKVERNWDNFNRTYRMVNMIRNATLYQLSFLQTQIQMTSRKLAYKQVLTTKDKILSMPATDNIKKQYSTFVKISPANFINTSVNLNDEYIAEAIEYSVNPFQNGNPDKIAANIIEVNLYNQEKTVISNEITKVKVENITVPIEFSFPASDNQNLTEFLKDYNMLSNFRNSERLKKEEMIAKSNLQCVYWDKDATEWSHRGCVVSALDNTHIKCQCNHLSAFSIFFQTPKLTVDAPLLNNSTQKANAEDKKTLQLSDIIRWPLDAYFRNLGELWQHNKPSFLGFMLKPGCIVLGLFWAMYLSSLVYYSGRDELKRYNMTKSQNREDLAELKDDETQDLMKVIRDLIVRDFLHENGRFIAKQALLSQNPQLNKKKPQPPQIKIYEQMSKEEKKKYKKRARRKVFGVPAGLCERAHRYYSKTMKHNSTNPNAKMSFFNEELKNNYWIGLIAKTSKIAPRHVRLVMMYFYASLYIIALTIIFAFQLQEYISENALFQVVVLSFALIIGVWLIGIPVALIFRMPLELRKKIAGVRTKKVNKAFREIDKYMGCRYAIGYFVCLSTYLLMTLMVIVFNLFYPQDYVIGWAFNIILIYIFDLVVFTFGLASLQMANVMISAKVKCWYKVWAAIEVFRYVKNLRG